MQLTNSTPVVLGTGEETKSDLGFFHDAVLNITGEYAIGIAAILEYEGAYSVSYAESESFFI